MLSSLVPILKGKGDPLNPNSYRGIKLLKHAFKLYEKISDGSLREVVDIAIMQYRFIPMRGTADAVCSEETFEKFRAKNKKLFLVDGVMTLYEGCKTTVSIDGELSSSFSVKLVVHQGSALSPFFYNGNGCSDSCEGWFINGAAVCRQSFFV